MPERLTPMRLKSFLLGALAAACSFHALPAHEATRRPDRPRMEVVFVLDTTGSMSGMIAGAKQKIWAIEIGRASCRERVLGAV